MSAINNYIFYWQKGIKKIFAIIGKIKDIVYPRLFDKNWTYLNDKENNKLFTNIKNKIILGLYSLYNWYERCIWFFKK